MACKGIWKSAISLSLVLALVFVPVLQVSAEEFSENPQQQETQVTEATETMEIPEETETTEAPEQTEETEETTVPETTVPETTAETEIPAEQVFFTESEEMETLVGSERPEEGRQPQDWTQSDPLPISEILGMTAGTNSMVIQGTVVYADAYQAVLQDETGGIRLSSISSKDVTAGEILKVLGHRTAGFSVETFEKQGNGDLPAVEGSLDSCPGDVRILIRGAVLGRNGLSQNGSLYQLEGDIPEGLEPGDRVDAWGVLLDGVFYADTILKSESQATEEIPDSAWNFYFGLLHAHTDLSDGTGSVQEAFAHAKAVEGLDFFAVTDHSNSFDNADHGCVTEDGCRISQDWAAGKKAAVDATDETFVGIFGYEMTWQETLSIGHMNTFGTPGWQTREQEDMDTLKGYLDALAAVPDSVSQFNHPGPAYGDFDCFAEYDPFQDALVHLLEVGSEGSFTAYDAYTTALDAGWHLAPSNNQNNHHGNWGSESGDRTVVLAQELTEEAIFDAIRNHRVYATEDADLKIEYHLNDQIMGSILSEQERLTAEIVLGDGSGDIIGLAEVITDGGKVAASTSFAEAAGKCTLEIPAGGSYYYVRIIRNEKTVAVTAPVWIDTYEDVGITDFSCDVLKPEQGTEVNLLLSLHNNENLPFVVEKAVFSLGEEPLQTVFAPGNVEPVGKLEIPLPYTQKTPGAVTITATVTGTIGEILRTYQRDITLYFQSPEAELKSVEDVRQGLLGDAYRIRGYVTAGTANRHNTFPDSIYLQDETGGMEIMDFTREGIQLGTPMEIEGVLRSTGGNLVLAMTDYEILDADYYRHVPRTMSHRNAMNYENHGGELLQVEGSVISVTQTPDQKGVSRFTIRDILGDLATVIVEADIGSGAYGTNELITEVRKNKTVRAMGLLHIDEYGKTVLRVRNCDEVVYVPPINDPSNPKTGDCLARLLHWFSAKSLSLP